MPINTQQQINKMSDLEKQEYITDLEDRLSNHKRAEKLQSALFKIASINHKDTDLKKLYQKIHKIVSELIYAKNFVIAIYDENKQCLRIAYLVDEKDNIKDDSEIPLGTGLSSYVIKTREPQLLNMKKINKLISEGELEGVVGSTDFTSWMGSPMISANMLHGLIVIQSYEENIIYTDEDLELLNFVAKHIAIAIEEVVSANQKAESQAKLANQHRLLEHKNDNLNQLIIQLKSAQTELIQKEKMASLGGLVAGIAHEINTPLGICVTGVSHLQEEFKRIKGSLASNTLTQNKLIDFFDDLDEVLNILSTNTQRGASLVNSFKQVAVDQTSNEARHINLQTYINEIILSLKPTLKRTAINLRVVCDEFLSLNVDAGAISQILSNLILNSVKHGFDEGDKGNIVIKADKKEGYVLLNYHDDGKGLDDNALKMLFEPFYTTKRGAGGSGLGTHLVYNLVTSSLNGSITAQSQLGKGLTYEIKFPFA